MINKIPEINQLLLNASSKSAEKFLYAFLDREDEIISCLKGLQGIKSEIYIKEIDAHLEELIRFSSVFSDLTLINTTFSVSQKSDFVYFDPQSNYWKDRQITIPPNYISEIGDDPSRFLLCYIHRNNLETKRLFQKYHALILKGKLMVRPLRGMYLKAPHGQPGTLYYVDPNTDNNHWYINEINDKNYFVIDNGMAQNDVMKVFSITVPYLKNININDLAKIIVDESDLLGTFRANLKKLVNEAGDNLDRLKSLKEDVIRPAIENIQRKFTTIINSHRLSIGASVGAFTLTLVIATVNGNLLQAMSSTLPVAAMVLSENNYQDKLNNLKDSPYYLLWRIEKIANLS